jgi:uncharacterized protein (TIGR02266 family)
MAEGNRKDPRARVLNMTVRYKSATVDEFIENHSHDISRGGIFIKTRSPFPAGTLLKFEVRIAEDQKLMHGVGRVVWRREVDRAEESYPAGMGIKFIKTGEGAAELINQLLAARQGAESSFDAGVREAVATPGAVRPSAVPPATTPLPQKPISASPTSSPALSVDSGPRSLPTEAETAVTSPAKKRQDQAPEKRKVVLQGSALESPPSKPRPSPRPVASTAEASPQRPGRGSIAEETTARRTRPSAVKTSDNPRWTGLVVILGLVGLVVFVVNRMRGPSADEESTAAPMVAAEPATLPPPAPIPPPPATAAEVRPSDEVAPAVDPAQPPVQPASATEPAITTDPASEPPAPGSAAPSAAPAPTSAPSGTSAPAAPVPSAPPAASVPPSPAPPSAATPKAPAPPAAQPAPPKPAPAPVKPVAPKPSASVAPAAPPAPKPEPEPKPAEPAPAPPAAAAGSGGDTASPSPPAKKPPAASAPTPPAAAPPAATPPAAAPPTPPPPPAGDDNPY